MRTIRIGSGAGYGGDRIEPAIDLICRGELDYIIFECLAERTIALAQLEKLQDPEKGYNSLLERRFSRILDVYREHPVKIVTNMGAANPEAAVRKVCSMAKERGLTGLKIAAVAGDDLLPLISGFYHVPTMETDAPLGELKDKIVSANAYLGCGGIVEALKQGADIIITGRVSDPALVLGPLIYEFGWQSPEMLGKGTLAGHLLECAGQVTGGYYAEPGVKDVPELWNLGFPIAEVQEDGTVTITKLPGCGGMVTCDTVKEQLIYELQDPANYFTPDCVADFQMVSALQEGKDRVKLTGASGKPHNGCYKVSVGYRDGYIGEGEISYGGANALARAKLAAEIIGRRLDIAGIRTEEVRYDLIGCSSLYPEALSHGIQPAEPAEVRLRVAARTLEKADAEAIGLEVEALYTNGPAGGGGANKRLRPILSVASILVPQEMAKPTCEIVEVL